MPENALPTEPARVFAEPWHASVFALAVKLSEAGYFTWHEWSEAFGARLREERPLDGCAGDTRPMPEVDSAAYYDVWLDTLESLLIQRGLASPTDLADLKAAWTKAYLQTPHGMPVKIGSDRAHAPAIADDHADD
jgi:nitrile hydratase accessory protein